MSKAKKLIIFDLDGVLLDAKEAHFHCLNEALAEVDYKYMITPDQHVSRFDGLSTAAKLKILHDERGLPMECMSDINKRKQELTLKWIEDCVYPDQELVDMFKLLNKKKVDIAVASNSIEKTVVTALNSLNLIQYVSRIYSNQDVEFIKPNPSVYLKAMSDFGVTPENTLIVEDSAVGREAALLSGAKILPVKNPYDTIDYFNWLKILDFIKSDHKRSVPWVNPDMTVLIPMAGAGNRFAQVGYKRPKPLIDVLGQPMIKQVVDSLNVKARYVFIVQKKHYEKYNLDVVLPLIVPGCHIVQVDGVTEGAACTSLLAKEYIDNDQPLMIVNSDQYIEWDANKTMYKIQEQNWDGAILTFKANEPKWSYCRVDESGSVVEVAEKRVISDDATVGVYYWKHGYQYVNYAKQMIEKNIRVNNEFYICPVFNEAIHSGGLRIGAFPVDSMHGLGTPEDLERFIEEAMDK